MNTVFIGAGNLATSLSVALRDAGHPVIQVWSRTLASARTLAQQLGPEVSYTASLQDIVPADLYVFAVTDTALEQVIGQVADVLPRSVKQSLFVHTACTQPLRVLAPLKPFGHTGVLYPFQTFSRQHIVDLSHTAFFVDAANPETQHRLRDLVLQLSSEVYDATDRQRLYLHLSGVMASNFSNCLYALADEVLQHARLPFRVLLPVIDETAHKIHTLSPREAQSGPASRGDQVTLQKHLQLLADLEQDAAFRSADTAEDIPSLREVYRFFTHNIRQHLPGK